MNFLKKGPELKLSAIKVPDFLSDLWYDLRERHLLPLVAVLAVAIVAVPIALGGSSGSDESESGTAIAAPSAAVAQSGELIVAKAAPGLRDYRKRLANQKPTDPFEQQFDEDPSGTGEGSASSTESATVVTDEGSSVSLEATSPSGSVTDVVVEPSAGGTTEVETKYASDTVDVRIVAVPSGEEASASEVEPTVRRKVPELTMLPSRETPVAVFMGASSDGKKALLLISSDVQSVFGDGRCVVGSQVCQLMALEKGLPETFVYGPQGRTYRIEVLKIDRTLTDKPQRASLGKSKKKG